MFIKTFRQGYVKNNMAKQAIDLFNQVKNADEILVNLLFNACAQLGTKEALLIVKQVSKQMPESFYSNTYILSSLLDALMKCEDVAHARSLFDGSNNKTLPMYAVMMKGNNYQRYKCIYRGFSSRLCAKQYGKTSD